MSATDYTTMDRQLPGGRFFIPLCGVEYYFERVNGNQARLFEAVDCETGDCIPVDTVEVPETVEDTLRSWGYELVDDAESLAGAM